MLAGHRPLLWPEDLTLCLVGLSFLPSPERQASKLLPPPDIYSVDSIRHPSILIAPVPCSNTLLATVPLNGLRATTIGSCAGLIAVPQPFQCAASFVAWFLIISVRGKDLLPGILAKSFPPERECTTLPTATPDFGY